MELEDIQSTIETDDGATHVIVGRKKQDWHRMNTPQQEVRVSKLIAQHWRRAQCRIESRREKLVERIMNGNNADVKNHARKMVLI